MDINFILQYINVVVLGICLCVGYVIKSSLDFIPNKYIPLIMLCLGVLLNILFHLGSRITGEIILVGMVSGLASTGLHQMFKNLLFSENKGV